MVLYWARETEMPVRSFFLCGSNAWGFNRPVPSSYHPGDAGTRRYKISSAAMGSVPFFEAFVTGGKHTWIVVFYCCNRNLSTKRVPSKRWYSMVSASHM